MLQDKIKTHIRKAQCKEINMAAYYYATIHVSSALVRVIPPYYALI